MILLPPPPQPVPIVAAQHYPTRRPPTGALYQHRPIHAGYREGRPSPTIRWGAPVEVLGRSRGQRTPRTTYFMEGGVPRAMPTRQFNQRFVPFSSNR